MTISEAYSLELDRNISAGEADSLFQQNKISSKYAFRCVECCADIVCANLDKPKSMRRVDPYFKYTSDHEDDCEIGISEASVPKKTNGRADDELPFLDVNLVKLNLNASASSRLPPDASTELSDKTTRSSNASSTSSDEKKPKGLSNWRLPTIVNAFREKVEFNIDIGSERLSQDELFVSLKESPPDNKYSDEPRIYFGKAWINYFKDGDFIRINFADVLSIGTLSKRPTILISRKKFSDATTKRLNFSEFLRLSNNKRPIDVYIFSQSGPYPKDDMYINLFLQSINHLHYVE